MEKRNNNKKGEKSVLRRGISFHGQELPAKEISSRVADRDPERPTTESKKRGNEREPEIPGLQMA